MTAKRKSAFVMCLMLGFVLFVTGTALAQPADIQGHWAEDQISDFFSRGLAGGYQDGSFRPDNSITRAEFITLINRYFGFTETSQISFNDVLPEDWFYDEIARAVKAGYISGYPDGSMKPNNFITREEVTVIIFKLQALEPAETVELLDEFADAGLIPQWSKQYINAVVAKGLMLGYPDKTFQPSKFITRAEAIMVLLRQDSSSIGKPEKPGDTTPSGGNSRHAVDNTPPKVTGLSITVENTTYPATIEDNSGVIDFSEMDPESSITAGYINVSEAPVTLTLTAHSETFSGYGLSTSQQINSKSIAKLNILDVVSYLGELDTGKPGISLMRCQQIFGNDITFSGILTDKSNNSTEVFLNVKLPVPENSSAN